MRQNRIGAIIVFKMFIIAKLTMAADLDFYSRMRFPREQFEEDANVDKVFDDRHNHIISICGKYGDPTRQEHFNVSEYEEMKLEPRVGLRKLLLTQPSHHFCLPSLVAEEQFASFYEAVKPMEEDGQRSDGKKFNVIFVMHPFRRLGQTFINLDKHKQLAKSLQKYSGDITFVKFVQFLLNGYQDFKIKGIESEEMKQSLQQLLPYHFSCNLCGEENVPDFVIKIDEHFERDMGQFLENFGLDELVDAEAVFQEAFPSARDMKKLFSQLSLNLLDELTNKYRIDFEMFRYSPFEFYP